MSVTSSISKINNKNFIHIDKLNFINYLELANSDSSNLLNSLKKDFNTIQLKINGNIIDKYADFLDYMINNYNSHLKNILLLSSNSSFINIINKLKENIDNDYHIIFDKDIKPKIGITLHHLSKQLTIKLELKIFKLNTLNHINSEKNINIFMVCDLINMEPILLVINNL